jgi:hypothetical protein
VADGRREVLGFQVGESEDGAFWTVCLRSLKSCGLAGVQLVISDAHSGLPAAIEAILIGASWQRCRVGPGALCFSLRPHLGAQDDGLLIDRLGAVTGEYAHGRFPDHFYVTRVRGNGLDLVAGLFEGFVHILGGAGFLAGNLQEADFGEEDLSTKMNQLPMPQPTT